MGCKLHLLFFETHVIWTSANLRLYCNIAFWIMILVPLEFFFKAFKIATNRLNKEVEYPITEVLQINKESSFNSGSFFLAPNLKPCTELVEVGGKRCSLKNLKTIRLSSLVAKKTKQL